MILITFSLLRVIGASFQLATIHYPSRSVYGGALICDAIGISPLTVLNLGLLARVNRFVPRKMNQKLFGILSIASLVAVSLGIHGGTKVAQSSNPFKPNSEVKAAVCIFTAIYVIAVGIFLMLLNQRSTIPGPEMRLLYCFAACAPFVVVRLAYALIADFSGDKKFNAFSGNTTIYLCMSALMEIIAVAFCVVTGLTLRKLPAEFAQDQQRSVEEGKVRQTSHSYPVEQQ